MTKFSKTLLIAGAVVVGGSQMFATSLAPGGTVTVPFSTVLPLGTPLATLTTTGSWSNTALKQAGIVKVVSAAYFDKTTKGIDFFYEIENTYTGATRASDTLNLKFILTSFAGAKANIFQLRATGSGSYFGPFTKPNPDAIQKASRSTGAGSNLTLNVTMGLVPRFNTSIFEVQTNAKGFGSGLALLSWNAAPPAGSIGNADTQFFDLGILDPVLTPEPGFYGLLAVGFAALMMFVKRRKANATPAA